MGELTTAIHSTLEDYILPGTGSTRYFAKVFKGEPSALMPGGTPVARWHVARIQDPPEGPRVLTDQRMVACVFVVNCYWPLSGTEGAQQNQEDDITTVLMTLPNAFVDLIEADYTLAGYGVSALTIENVLTVERAPVFPASEQEMRVLTFEVHARILEAA